MEKIKGEERKRGMGQEGKGRGEEIGLTRGNVHGRTAKLSFAEFLLNTY